MTWFKITAANPAGEERVYYYENITSEMRAEDGSSLNPETNGYTEAVRVSKETPGKKHNIKTLKIQLGLSCNYECSYCSQRFVPHADATSAKHVAPFLDSLSSWFDGGSDGLGTDTHIQFWGGEPFVYWKTLKPLAEALMERYPHTSVWFPTNGSLLDQEKNDWIVKHGFNVSISHDGPGQWVRGPDPLDDPQQRAAILDLFERLHPLGKISFNACINKDNPSRAAIVKFFKELTGREDVQIGEGAFVDAYDEGGISLSIDPQDMKSFSWSSFKEIREGSASSSNIRILDNKVKGFIKSLQKRRNAASIGQKCGMDKPENIAVDLMGNVLTCQNVSAAAIAPNGQPHNIGHVNDLSSVKLDTATHWSFRKDCEKCPVLQLCGGSCMFLEGDLWEKSCNNAFADNIPFFAAGFEVVTGMIPIKIEGGREDRIQLFDYSDYKPKSPRRIIPLKAI